MAERAYQDALQIDPQNAEAMEGLVSCRKNNDEDPSKARERALNDPEVQKILSDPGMRLILEQMSNVNSFIIFFVNIHQIFWQIV